MTFSKSTSAPVAEQNILEGSYDDRYLNLSHRRLAVNSTFAKVKPPLYLVESLILPKLCPTEIRGGVSALLFPVPA